MNNRNFLHEALSTPANLALLGEIVRQIQQELAPEEIPVTRDYVDAYIDLAAQGELPAMDSPGWAQFGANDWLLLPIVSAVVGVLQTRFEAGAPPLAPQAWETITEDEVQTWVVRTGSRRARGVVTQLTRALQSAFSQYLGKPEEPAHPSGGRELRFTDISCPAQVWRETPRFQVVVRLTPEPRPGSVASQQLAVKTDVATVQVDLQAPAFDILNAVRQEITIRPDGDSTAAVFDLRPREPGYQQLCVDFFQAGHPLGPVSFFVEVTDRPASVVPVQAAVTRLVLGSEVPAPDRILRVAWNKDQTSLLLSLVQDGGTSWTDFPPFKMNDPAGWVTGLFETLDFRPKATVAATTAQIEKSLKILGQSLWNILPKEFQSLYARDRKHWENTSLLVYSDEPYLPWELIWPYDVDSSQWQDPDPWCLTLRLSRWLRCNEQGNGNPGAPGTLSLSALAYIAPDDSELVHAQRERDFLFALLQQRGIQDVSPEVPDRTAVLDLLGSTTYDWVHVAAHGAFRAGPADQRSMLFLQGQQTLTPQHLVGPEIEGHLRIRRPVFFFNTCQAGRLGWGPTGIEGWAARLISCGAGMFLGPLAMVPDDTALLMARSVYEALLSEQNDEAPTVAEAVRQARRVARQAGDPAWLSYSLYAHPNAKVRWTSARPEDRAQDRQEGDPAGSS